MINRRDLEAPALQENPPTHAHAEETLKLALDFVESPPKDALTLKLDMLAGILHSSDCAARLTPLISLSGYYLLSNHFVTACSPLAISGAKRRPWSAT